MSALLRGILSARSVPVLRTGAVQRASIHSKPAKESIGTVESTIGLLVFTVSILAPAAWVLSNLESYKKKN
ncbi:cytochrome c oxidase subunit 8A, mitochondrial [Polypterus senegalus]|uniref:cytochrome c oxidase subunit 8A, mitochondrial n=1 Tax=Polypterus senegalus TaxID=55291 RepID=UPI001964711C|nr:cytochrome c oxidase subunit 8A, mitochondrial [Polypterus senegalus]